MSTANGEFVHVWENNSRASLCGELLASNWHAGTGTVMECPSLAFLDLTFAAAANWRAATGNIAHLSPPWPPCLRHLVSTKQRLAWGCGKEGGKAVSAVAAASSCLLVSQRLNSAESARFARGGFHRVGICTLGARGAVSWAGVLFGRMAELAPLGG